MKLSSPAQGFILPLLGAAIDWSSAVASVTIPTVNGGEQSGEDEANFFLKGFLLTISPQVIILYAWGRILNLHVFFLAKHAYLFLVLIRTLRVEPSGSIKLELHSRCFIRATL